MSKVWPALGTVLLLTVMTLASGAASEGSVRPSFVLVVTDDQSWNSIGRCLEGFDADDLAAGDDACMPHLQRELVAGGTTFLRAHTVNAMCCPSRASILTGRDPRHTGVTSNQGGFIAFDDRSTIATWLHDAGYRTGLVGKYLNGYGLGGTTGYVPPGWDDWHGNWDTIAYTHFSLLEKIEGAEPLLVRYDDTASTSTDACGEGNFYLTDLLCRRALEFLAGDTGRRSSSTSRRTRRISRSWCPSGGTACSTPSSCPRTPASTASRPPRRHGRRRTPSRRPMRP